MSSYSVFATPSNAIGQRINDLGSRHWEVYNSSTIAVAIGASQNAKWYIWQLYMPQVTAGENVTLIRMTGGHDYTVDVGGTDKTRQCVMHIRYGSTPDSFTGQVGTAAAGVFGSGIGQTITLDMGVSGMSSDAIRTGNAYVGISARTNGGDPGFPDGLYRNGVLNWDIYTGNSTPAPPQGDPFGTLTNPTANRSPGKFAGQQFSAAELNWNANGRGTQIYIDYYWDISGPSNGVTFASNGTQAWRDTSGYAYNPNWWISNTGLINISPNATPGTYTIKVHADDRIQGVANVNLTSQLVVRPRYDQLTEF